jgi:hypothetical protein
VAELAPCRHDIEAADPALADRRRKLPLNRCTLVSFQTI